MPFGDAAWLTITTATTVGYGDLSASTTAGRAATVILLYFGGIFVLAKTAGDYFDYRNDQKSKKLKGEWRWNLSGHILILNSPSDNGEQYLTRLIGQFRSTDEYHGHTVQILSSEFPNGLPAVLRDMENVVHYHGRADLPENMRAVSIEQADLIIVLAKSEAEKVSDGCTFDILHRVGEFNTQGRVLAECTDDQNRERLLGAGADVVIRPIRAYPEMIVRAFVAPGSECIIENMFTSSSDEFRRYDFPIKDMKWSDIVCKVAVNDLGTAIAYIHEETNELDCNPPASEQVNAKSLFLMVREEHIPNADKVIEAITGLS